MTLLERALGLFIANRKFETDLEYLNITDIVSSISSTSNDWNRAAILLAADHEQSSGLRNSFTCYPTKNIDSTKEFPRLTTLEWNELALELLEKAERNRKESTNNPFHEILNESTHSSRLKP